MRTLSVMSDGRLKIVAPYEDRVLAKSINGYEWVRSSGAWIYPKSSAVDIFNTFTFDAVDIKAEVILEQEKRKEAQLNDIKNKVGLEQVKPDFLMIQQKQCLSIARIADRYAFFLDTGTGKTLASLAIMHELGEKFVVVTPKSITRTGWYNDARDFYPKFRLLPLSMNFKREHYVQIAEQWGPKYREAVKHNTQNRGDLITILSKFAQAFVVNSESFKKYEDTFFEHNVIGLIVDESTTIKTHNSNRTKFLTTFADSMKYVYILTGKPAPQSEMDYYSQMRLVSPTVFGKSFYKFRDQYFQQADYMGYKFEPRPEKMDDLMKRIDKFSLFVSKADCLDLPDKTYITIDVFMKTEQIAMYRRMEKDRIAILQDDMVTATEKVSSLMKLRQITSGFLYKEDHSFEWLFNTKLNQLLATISEIEENEKILIWIQFKPEVEAIKAALEKKGHKVCTAYGGTVDLDSEIEEFKNGEARFMIAHPKTIKYGVTFTKCAIAIYYSMSNAFEDYYQSHDRIYRKGQTRPCTFIHLNCVDSIDEDIMQSKDMKGSNSALVEAMIKRISTVIRRGDSA